MAWLLFDEPFTFTTLVGTLATMAGVWLVSRAART
jgi:drug/metabolite transporter (DMT)-like permease